MHAPLLGVIQRHDGGRCQPAARSHTIPLLLCRQASGLKQGLGCLSVLLSHLGLLDDADSRGSFNLSILQLSDHLHYDASAAKALSVFPEARGEVYRPSVQQPGEAPAGPSDPAMEGEGGRKAQVGEMRQWRRRRETRGRTKMSEKLKSLRD